MKVLEDEKGITPERSSPQETIQLGAEINKMETNKQNTKNINETKSQFFEKINDIGKPLVKLINRQRDKIQMNKIREVKGDITTDIKKPRESYLKLLKPIFQQIKTSKRNGQFS